MTCPILLIQTLPNCWWKHVWKKRSRFWWI